MLQMMPNQFLEISQALARKKQIENEQSGGLMKALGTIGGAVIGTALGSALGLGGGAAESGVGGDVAAGGVAGSDAQSAAAAASGGRGFGLDMATNVGRSLRGGGGLLNSLGSTITSMDERSRREAEINDVRNALLNPSSAKPTTMAGIDALMKGQDRATDADRYADRQRLGEAAEGRAKTKFDWEAEDRADKDAAEAEIVRLFNESESRPGMDLARQLEAQGIPSLGIGSTPPDLPTTPAGVKYKMSEREARAAAAEAKRKADIEERETKVKEKSAESMSGRRDVLNERDRAKMATADGVLSDEFPEAKPVTRNGALTAAITILRMRVDPDTMKPVEPTTQEVINKAREIMTGVNAPLNGAPQTSPLDAEGKELFGD